MSDVMRRFSLPRRRVCAGLLAACMLAACARAQAPTPTRTPNIVVVLVDTLRADRLGVYGNSSGLTPFVDSLAQHGVVFHQAYAQAPWTNPSVASLFTSRYQSQHGVVSFASNLASSEITLAEVLRDQGYAAGGFLANGLVGRHRGYDQGFDEYVALWGIPSDPKHPKSLQKPRTSTINALAESWLDELPMRKPFFLYVHYIEPHSPYSPPDAYLKRFGKGSEQPSVDSVGAQGVQQVTAGATSLDAETPNLEQLYDGEVASMDAGVKDLWTTLERRDLLDDTVFVFTADHGEAFSEHGYMGHGKMLYNEEIRVPLLMVLPGKAERVDVDEPVALVDVAPTLVDLSGGVSPPTFEGRSLLPLVRRTRHPWLTAAREIWQRAPAAPPVFSEKIVPGQKPDDGIFQHERAIVMNGRKLIVGLNGEHQTFDVVHDPGENTPLTGHEDDVLAETVGAFRARVALNTLDAPPIDAQLRARMRALGYVD